MSIINELFQPGLYKRNQGRLARQVTFGVIALLVVVGAWRLNQLWVGRPDAWRIGVPLLIAAAGLWLAYRLVNLSNFADFLISVEGEMAKVSWPSRTELIRSSIVVIVTIIFLAIILFAYDLIWQTLLKAIGVI